MMDLEALHTKCSAHKAALESSTLAGCFYCQQTFPPSTITAWVRSDARRDVEPTTALCPLCSVDAVLAGNDVEPTPDVLAAMHARWFERRVAAETLDASEAFRLLSEKASIDPEEASVSIDGISVPIPAGAFSALLEVLGHMARGKGVQIVAVEPVDPNQPPPPIP